MLRLSQLLHDSSPRTPVAQPGDGHIVVQHEDQFDHWVDMVCSNYVAVECQRDKNVPFQVEMMHFSAGPTRISTVVSGPMSYRRSSSSIHSDPRDEMQVSLLLEGEMIIEQCGRQAHLRSGEMVLYDAQSPFSLFYPGPYRSITVKLPTPLLAARVPRARDHTAMRMTRDGMGAVAGATLTAIVEQAFILAERQRDTLSGPLLDIIALSVESELDRSAAHLAPRGRPLRRIQKWMLEHLGDPDLTVEQIASAHAITPRTLNRMFAAEGASTMQWLSHRRLEAAYSLLTERRALRVTDAAFQCGFNEMTHFGRRFREKFGIRPSDLLAPGRLLADRG